MTIRNHARTLLADSVSGNLIFVTITPLAFKEEKKILTEAESLHARDRECWRKNVYACRPRFRRVQFNFGTDWTLYALEEVILKDMKDPAYCLA